MHKKINLPTKDCLYCKRSFTWRKKWERCWDEVRFCSKRCKGEFKKTESEEQDPASHKKESSCE